MKNYDAYIFDFDYTLADATEPVVQSFLYKFNLFWLHILFNAKFSCYNLLIKNLYHKEKSDEITVPNTVFIGDAKEVLQILKNRGKKIGIVSSRWGQRINDIFENLNSRELIDFIIGTEHVENYKPNPEGLFKMIDMTHLLEFRLCLLYLELQSLRKNKEYISWLFYKIWAKIKSESSSKMRKSRWWVCAFFFD